MKDYTQCYFAYLDILGFKVLVRKKQCSEIASLFDEAKKHYVFNEIREDGIEVPIIPAKDIHYYIMSDSICIYISDKYEHALSILMLLCMNLQVRMLCCDTPVLLRGSISRGGIYEDKGILFGPALVEAYQRAEELAHTPRIVIPSNLYEGKSDQFDKAILNRCTYLDTDGFYVTNYVDFFCTHNSYAGFRESVYNYIELNLSESMSKSVRDKYLYLKYRMDHCKQNEKNA